MSSDAFEADVDRPLPGSASLTPEETRELRRKADEKAQMVGLLRHFAETFGAGEVYREARAIYMELPEGERMLEEQKQRIHDEMLRDQDSGSSTRLHSSGSHAIRYGRKPAKKNDASYEEAKRLLGG